MDHTLQVLANLAVVIFIAISFILGYFVSGIGSDINIKKVAGLGTAQRNVSAALVVGTQNFSNQPNVLVMIIVGALLMLVILMVIGGEMGRRGQSKATVSPPLRRLKA